MLQYLVYYSVSVIDVNLIYGIGISTRCYCSDLIILKLFMYNLKKHMLGNLFTIQILNILYIVSLFFTNHQFRHDYLHCTVSRDTQRLACLRSALHCFSTIAAPASRFTEMGNKKKTKINTDSTRKQLHNTFSQLAIKLESNKHRMNVPDNSDKVGYYGLTAGFL